MSGVRAGGVALDVGREVLAEHVADFVPILGDNSAPGKSTTTLPSTSTSLVPWMAIPHFVVTGLPWNVFPTSALPTDDPAWW
jgi:hypothetical protein